MGRRGDAPRKGDLREQALLDAAEALLERTGLEELTVEAIAKGAGISRGSLYFYFGSKHEVLAALVERTMRAVRAEADNTAQDAQSPPPVLMERAVRGVEQVWREHGTVMRAAVDHSALHPVIGAAWDETVEAFAATMTPVLVRAGLPGGDGPEAAPALARALCWMTERTFYRAFCSPGRDLAAATATTVEVWRRVMAA
ncbi:TetR/AcrR family transcriptional regulator [Actinacidiphila acididurans]|uniref:TetR/AcrR family transcriptional regulator n=1 Tax=Actinacidiphila acididurans TaxID=2784346 RepID=A0ABS2TMK5_9ACTN|nr:TetR/AcrR family transcriptional regulator [Actinacidiphila acididurans]MBM9503480.1 TetR/AcrR family transcriptional regulator [Actinacidiphila acididurans]